MIFKGTEGNRTLALFDHSSNPELNRSNESSDSGEKCSLVGKPSLFKCLLLKTSEHNDPSNICGTEELEEHQIIEKPFKIKVMKKFQLFMDLEVEYNKEHLLKPLQKLFVENEELTEKENMLDKSAKY